MGSARRGLAGGARAPSSPASPSLLWPLRPDEAGFLLVARAVAARARLGLRPLLGGPPAADPLAGAGPPTRWRGRTPTASSARSAAPCWCWPRPRRPGRWRAAPASPTRRVRRRAAAWVGGRDRRPGQQRRDRPGRRQGRALRHPARDGLVLARAAGRAPGLAGRRVPRRPAGDARGGDEAEHRRRPRLRRRPARRLAGRAAAAGATRSLRGGRAGGAAVPVLVVVAWALAAGVRLRRCGTPSSPSAPTRATSSPRRVARARPAGSGCCC